MRTMHRHRHRRWLALLVAALLVLPLLSSVAFAGDPVPNGNPSAPSEFARGQAVPLRVMTYNIQYGYNGLPAGAGRALDMDGIADVIRQADPDVVALQEVDVHWGARSNFMDELQYLADKLGMHPFFGFIYDFDPLQPGQERRQFGPALLSKHEILRAENHPLSRISSQQPELGLQPLPGFPEIVINVKGNQVHVFSTHTYWLAQDVRQLEVEEMIKYLDETKGPRILMGDFNAYPGDPEMKSMAGAYTDVFAKVGEGPSGTYPAIKPTNRIDYIFTSPEIQAERAWVIDSTASDHRPVVADLTLRRVDPFENGLGPQ